MNSGHVPVKNVQRETNPAKEKSYGKKSKSSVLLNVKERLSLLVFFSTPTNSIPLLVRSDRNIKIQRAL